ncbi:MAG: hypothetical protein K9J12_07375 [Melioribacteraceae bacterium]|nr:hypothetical protein [Melioribacteraceae bacterium]MCF8265764.1 hypothetical protein [Melioribacteraceae bacterium]MCF8432109.1 hypothetical protein [Melioribacteraceae bacterium]
MNKSLFNLRKVKTLGLFILCSLFLHYGCNGNPTAEEQIEDYHIKIEKRNLEFLYANKANGFYLGNTNKQNSSYNYGWFVEEKKVFSDYEIFPENDTLIRSEAKTLLYLESIKREHKEIFEEFFLADHVDLIVLTLDGIRNKKVKIRLNDILEDDSAKLSVDNNMIHINREPMPILISSQTRFDSAKVENKFLDIYCDKSEILELLIMVDTNKTLIKDYQQRVEEIKFSKINRIRNLLQSSEFHSNIDLLDLNLAWAKVMLNSMYSDVAKNGILTGLPNTNFVRGRENMISLPGATYIQNQFFDAKEILRTFSASVDQNINSPTYSRVANEIGNSTNRYNSADVTAQFVINLFEYFSYSNDRIFLNEMFDLVKTNTITNLEKNTDEFGFLVHSGNETWMNNIGQNGEITPRGNRANEIQALWYRQLEATIAIAEIMEDEALINLCTTARLKLERNFQKFFISADRTKIYDFINSDNEPDTSFRPNLFFSLNINNFFEGYKERLKIMAEAFNELVLPEGPVSIGLNDLEFHPYVEYRPYYLKEEALHNGMIWFWNFGQAITALNSYGINNLSWQLTENLNEQLSSKGVVGGIAEYTAPFVKPGRTNKRLLGAKVHSPALAEYIRNFYQDYLGAYPDAPNNTLYLIPSLPDDLTMVEFKQRVGEQFINVKYQFTNLIYRVYLSPGDIFNNLKIGISITNLANANYQLVAELNENENLMIEIPAYSMELSELNLSKDGVVIDVEAQIYVDPKENKLLYDNIKFTNSANSDIIKSYEKAEFEFLPSIRIKAKPDSSANTIVEVSDKINDERYSYPTNSAFKDGICDLTKFEVKSDSSNYYFSIDYRNLSNPGWNPEIGYQLTFTSILIQSPDDPNLSLEVGYNSNYRLSQSREFNRQLTVGSGIEIKDGTGKLLAAYLPEESDIRNPLGSVTEGNISFAVPIRFVGEINKNTVISVLVGSQDDFGGAGIGKFRLVEQRQSEWHGGRRAKGTVDNIYDFLLIN